MITLLRKHHQWLMIIIAILSIPFVFYFVQKPDYGAAFHNDTIGTIYDRPVSQTEYSWNAHLLTLASALGMSLPSDLMANQPQTENDMYVEFTWNRLILRHEAEKLGIRPTQDEITDFVKTLPRFQEEGRFDINKYSDFAKDSLPAMGFNESQIAELASDQLTINKLKDMLSMWAQFPEAETKDSYEKFYGKLYVSAVHLQEDEFKKDLRFTDEEISKYFDAHKDTLKSDESRKVEFVSFMLTDDEKKLKGKERVELLQKLADKANDFSQALLEKDAKFADVASRLEAPVVTTDEFTGAKPAPQFGKTPQLSQAAFQLTLDAPMSDPIQGTDGFYIMHLLGVTEAKSLDLEGAKTKIVEALATEKVRQVLATRGMEVAQQMRNALQTKTPLDLAISRTRLKLSPWWPQELAVGLGLNKATEPSELKLESYPPFALVDVASGEDQLEPSMNPSEMPTIKNTVSNLQPGEVSEYTPVTDGGFVIALEKRDPADPAGYAEAKTKYETNLMNQRRRTVFVEWIRDRRKAANVTGAGANTMTKTTS